MTQYLYDLSDTWNNIATTFDAIKMNVTDNNSATASKLIDLQVGGTSRFRVRKDGLVAGVNSACWLSHGAGSYFAISSPTATPWASISPTAAVFPLAGSIGFGNLAAGVDASADTMLFRDGASGILAQRNGTAAQTFNLYNTYSSATIYERLSISARSAASVQIMTNKGSGGGTVRALEFGVDNNVCFGVGVNNELFANGRGSLYGRVMWSADGSFVASNLPLFFHAASTTGSPTGNDPALNRDGNSQLGQRNGTNAQTFSLYSTSSSSNANYERLSLVAQAAGAFRIHTQKAGTGAAQALELGTDGTTRLTISTGGNVTLNASGAGILIPANGYFSFTSNGLVTAPSDGVWRLTNNAQNDWGRLQFGGTTSSFPALKRSSATLICRLADDSANAAFESASVRTDAPTGGTAATWKLGTVATVSPTSPDRTIEVDIGGTIYYIHAKTTNN